MPTSEPGIGGLKALTMGKEQADKFTAIPNFIIENYLHKIGSPAFALYSVLKKFASYETGECFPKVDTLAQLLGVKRTAVHRSLKVLCRFGLIVKTSGCAGRSNRYFFPSSVAFMTHQCSENETFSVLKREHYVEPLKYIQRTRLNPSKDDFVVSQIENFHLLSKEDQDEALEAIFGR